jgi:hypothetical protein
MVATTYDYQRESVSDNDRYHFSKDGLSFLSHNDERSLQVESQKKTKINNNQSKVVQVLAANS